LRGGGYRISERRRERRPYPLPPPMNKVLCDIRIQKMIEYLASDV